MRRSWGILIIMSIVLSAALAACSPIPPVSGLLGSGKYVLRVEGREPIPVYYVTGARATEQATIIVVMHGVERNAADYRNTWTELVRDRDVVVVAPQFSDDEFPDAENYNLGGLADAEGSNDDDSRVLDGAYGYIEPLFEDARDRIGGGQSGFSMFGHSAGAQFVHRYVEFVPHAPVDVAVAANAGWYTMPDDSARFPFGLDGPDAPDFDATAAFGRQLIVLLGTDDVGTKNLRRDPDASAQGDTRLERGREFFDRSMRAAEQDGVAFRWELHEVPGVDHDQVAMAAAAVHYLLDRGRAR
ncbi:hydrolase [Microbacterium phyllosphaerae]